VTLAPYLTTYIDQVLPPRAGSDLVWHYTSAAGALGILQSGVLWLSAISVLNDAEEMQYGMRLIRERWESHQAYQRHGSRLEPLLHWAADEPTDDLFVACASTSQRSLSQYRAYGSYSLGINAGVALKVKYDDQHVEFTTPSETEASITLRNGWRPVQYEAGQQLEIIDQLFDVLASSSEAAPETSFNDEDDAAMFNAVVIAQITSVAAFLKHPDFAEENEVRLLGALDITNPAVNTRVSDLGMTAFVRAEPATVNEGGTFLQSLTIGPGTPDPVAAEAGARLALTRHGYSSVPVDIANIPFRSSNH
jgi:hypothetical protein